MSAVSPGKWRHKLTESDLRPRTLLVAHTLALVMDARGETFAGIRYLADSTNQAKDTITRCLAELVEAGWIEEVPGGRGSPTWRCARIPSVLPQDQDTQNLETVPESSESVLVSDAECPTPEVGPTSIITSKETSRPSASSFKRETKCTDGHDFAGVGPNQVCRRCGKSQRGAA